MKILYYSLHLLIPIVAPIAYYFRDYAQKNKKFLWWFLSDSNMYGDIDWRPTLKSKFWRAYLWMLRNPLQNLYCLDLVKGIDYDHKGYGKVKFGDDINTWRTMYCKETGNWHGKILDFEKSPFGVQNITFKRIDENGIIKNQYRKSICIPFRFLFWIVLFKNRIGHEDGLFQTNFTFPYYSYKENKEDYLKWKQVKWKKLFNIIYYENYNYGIVAEFIWLWKYKRIPKN